MVITESTPQMRIRGGGNDEDLYFVPSDEDEEEEEKEDESEEKSKNKNNLLIRSNNNIPSDTTDKNIVEEDKEDKQEKERERNKNNSTERESNNNTQMDHDEMTQETNKEKETLTTKKKLKVRQDSLPFGHVCHDIAVDDDTQYVRVYCQNVSGIFDKEGIGLDSAFKEIKQAGADIFTFNETHGDEPNAEARRALRLSKQRMWRDNNEDCKIILSSSTAPLLTFFHETARQLSGCHRTTSRENQRHNN
jgi:hypothetical protein